MKTITIPLSMENREAALLMPEREMTIQCANDDLIVTTSGCPNGHRGIWFYDPDVIGCEAEQGDIVLFTFLGDLLASGRVTQTVSPADYPKWCSRMNTKGFAWKELN